MSGFIYILSNPSFSNNRIKIGKSNGDPSSLRKDELYTTGVPEPFKLEYKALVEDHDKVEKKIHKILDNKRPNKKREFFISTIDETVSIIRKNSKIEYEKSYYKSPKEIENEKKQKEIEIQHNKEQARIKRNQSIERERLRKSNEIKRIHLEKITKLHNEKKDKIEKDWYWSKDFKEINLEIKTLEKSCYSLDLKLLMQNVKKYEPIFLFLFFCFISLSAMDLFDILNINDLIFYLFNSRVEVVKDLIFFLFLSLFILCGLFLILGNDYIKISTVYKPKPEVAEKIKSLEKLLVIKRNQFIASRKKISKILICKFCNTKNSINQKQLDNKKIYRPICGICKNSLLILK